MTSSTDQDAYRKAVRAFVRQEVAPIALECDRAGSSPVELHERFWQQGLAARFVSEDGASPQPYLLDGCIAAEELAYGCAAIASLIMLPVFFDRLVLRLLGDEARAEFRSRLVAHPTITSFAASERVAGSDLLQLQTLAERNDGCYVLNGHKDFSSNLRFASDVIVVARTAPPTQRSRDALTWFLVSTSAEGVTVGERWTTLGLRSMDLSPLDLHGVRVPERHRLGAEGKGLQLITDSLAQSRTGISAMAVGIARRARDEVIAYSMKRHLYGDKLYKLQDYRFRIAEMEKDIAAARALMFLSAQKYDQGLDHNKEASIAKLYAGEMVMRVTDAASMMLGSIGYTGHSIIEKLFRDARHVSIVEGPPPIHKEIIFATLLRGGGY